MSIELTARDILETGNLREFEEFLVENAENIVTNFLFDENVNFLTILAQTFRKVESVMVDRNEKIPMESYKNTMTFLVQIGCDINNRDSLGRTLGHWTIMLKSTELLSMCLRLGYNAELQDNEGQTIAHLAVREANYVALETIKLYAKDSHVLESVSITSGATPLIYAVQIGAVDVVKALLQLHVDLNMQENNKYKRTALHYALFTNNEDLFELLLKYKARTDIKDCNEKSVADRVVEHANDAFLRLVTHYASSEIFSNSDTSTTLFSPIMTACKNNDFDMLCELWDNVTDKEREILLTVDNDGRGALHYCAENTDERCAWKLIKEAPELINLKDKSGFVPLHLATISNNGKIVELLLKGGADINETDNEGHNSLHWAVVCCCVEVVVKLLEKEPEMINSGDLFGASPLHYSTQSFLSPNGSEQGPLVIKEILKNEQSDVNCVDDENRTPLLWAACLGITNCCEILLQNGANVNHRDSKGLTVLHCAASRGHYDIVELLVNSWSVSVDCVDNNLCTPLFYAVTLNHSEIVHFFLDNRSNPNHKDIKGRSVAHCAALKGFCDVLNIIFNGGGSLVMQNNAGDLPLHETAEIGQAEVCKLLLEKMLECNSISLIDLKDKSDHTPLHKAAKNNHKDICELLLEYGANPNILTNSKNVSISALDLATDPGTIAVLRNAGATSAKVYDKECSVDIDFIQKGVNDNYNESKAFLESNKDFTFSEKIRPFNQRDKASEIDKNHVKTKDLLSNAHKNIEKSLSKNNSTIQRNKNYQRIQKSRIFINQSGIVKSNPDINDQSIEEVSIRCKKQRKSPLDYSDLESAPSNTSSNNSEKNSLNNKHQDLCGRIIESVKEYKDVRNKMRALSDQRRMAMFTGFSKSANLVKYSATTRISNSSKDKRYSKLLEDSTVLPHICSPNNDVTRKQNQKAMTSEDQVKSAYQCELSLSSLVLY